MTRDEEELLAKAKESLSAAKHLMKGNYADFAASRAYYAMFYTTEAALETMGQAFSSHSAVISAFGKEFAKTGKVPPEFHKYLLEAQEERHLGDYGQINAITMEQAQITINRAEDFIAAVERFIQGAK